jgi:hypothetical protein
MGRSKKSNRKTNMPTSGINSNIDNNPLDLKSPAQLLAHLNNLVNEITKIIADQTTTRSATLAALPIATVVQEPIATGTLPTNRMAKKPLHDVQSEASDKTMRRIRRAHERALTIGSISSSSVSTQVKDTRKLATSSESVDSCPNLVSASRSTASGSPTTISTGANEHNHNVFCPIMMLKAETDDTPADRKEKWDAFYVSQGTNMVHYNTFACNSTSNLAIFLANQLNTTISDRNRIIKELNDMRTRNDPPPSDNYGSTQTSTASNLRARDLHRINFTHSHQQTILLNTIDMALLGIADCNMGATHFGGGIDNGPIPNPAA